MTTNKQLKMRGFTLVELLIVIVVIAILAAITLVAYNGIQNRAKNTAAVETANQVRNKIEAYNTIESHYPDNADVVKPSGSAPSEAKLDEGVYTKLNNPSTSGTNVTADKPVAFKSCTKSGSTAPTGGTVTYWQTDGNKTYALGICS